MPSISGVLEECTPASLARTLLDEFAALVAAAPTPEEHARLTGIQQQLVMSLRPHLAEETCTVPGAEQ